MNCQQEGRSDEETHRELRKSRRQVFPGVSEINEGECDRREHGDSQEQRETVEIPALVVEQS